MKNVSSASDGVCETSNSAHHTPFERSPGTDSPEPNPKIVADHLRRLERVVPVPIHIANAVARKFPTIHDCGLKFIATLRRSIPEAKLWHTIHDYRPRRKN